MTKEIDNFYPETFKYKTIRLEQTLIIIIRVHVLYIREGGREGGRERERERGGYNYTHFIGWGGRERD